MSNHQYQINLNGLWEVGNLRQYNKTAMVPGLISDPKITNKEPLWFRKKVTLPAHLWSHSNLHLKGARFCPSVYINGDLVATSEGGMAPINLSLKHPSLVPGNTIELEIELKGLDEVPLDDASRIPDADLWRSNVSSLLWDDIELIFYNHIHIKRMIPHYTLSNDSLNLQWELVDISNYLSRENIYIKLQLFDDNGELIIEELKPCRNTQDALSIQLKGQCKQWSPESPICYQLQSTILLDDLILDYNPMTIGLKEFVTDGIGFLLNNKPITLRAGTVVWHRWLRDPEASELAFNEIWFRENIVKRLKNLGANTLRFHLGMPPEKFLDLCDKYGLLIQAEWSFFHGMKGSKKSLVEQWGHWLDLCMKHPCIAIIHPWNETNDMELKVAYDALKELEQNYPPLVIGHRDVIHIHKYWWSLFENIGLYYDSAEEFTHPIMVDEFGGNYLDGNGNPGLYPTVKGSLLRFLGPNHTKEKRLAINRDANVKIAEYWRRIGAAGFSPFCMLGSPEDGNHHFMGPLQKGKTKPVMDALAVVYSPLSCSLNLWDRNFYPNQSLEIPVHLFNDTDQEELLHVQVSICDNGKMEEIINTIEFSSSTQPHSRSIKYVTITLPKENGLWTIKSTLLNPPKKVDKPVVSQWTIRTLTPAPDSYLEDSIIGVYDSEQELKLFLEDHGFDVRDMTDKNCDLIMTSSRTWNLLNKDQSLKDFLQLRLNQGCSIIMFSIGPRQLYLPGHTSALDGIYTPKAYEIENINLFHDIQIKFQQVPEPESCIHSANLNYLWDYLDSEATQIWNGLRGGLIVPTWDMEVNSPNGDAFLEKWSNRGADVPLLKRGDYYAYELAGHYHFSIGKSKIADEELRKKVHFLVEDAPALKISINPKAPINRINLSEEWRTYQNTTVDMQIKPLAICGKNLTRTPVIQVDLVENSGRLILSQLLTEGRLHTNYSEEGFYGIREDAATQQFVFNMMKQALSQQE
ncbi:glycoside hydrolase family 2 protein [Vallitalea okinawensis]|uniref:glycoside hydrolase n=1 Tax=Vallitalea okinawensis TaxID=2078660 RepID=UPI000CFB1632|nr:glycoside hydrolase [Vallitalea okinawensis]